MRAIEIKWIVWALLCLVATFTQAQTYDLNDNIRQAYKYAIRLELDASRQLLNEESTQHPDNLLVDFVADYVDFFELFISENEERFEVLEKNKSKRLNRLKKGDRSSPYYRFCIAEVHLHWAAVRLKFEENFKAAREILAANNLLEENEEEFPGFVVNNKSLSIIHALGESVPSWVRNLVGMKGSIQLGLDEIKHVLDVAGNDPQFLFYEESLAIYSYILLYQKNDSRGAYRIIKNTRLDLSASPLLTFLGANVYQRHGHTDEAITLLSSYTPSSTAMPFLYLKFMEGKYRMYHLEQGADTYMKRFVEDFGGSHFIKEAYQKLAWYELVVNNSTSAYQKYMQKALDHGAELTDEDTQAKFEAEEGEIPQAVLLRARLLFDGQYLDRAQQELSNHPELAYDSKYKVEYLYRMGRIKHEQGSVHDALAYYDKVTKYSSSYMACNAALQMGYIYEELNDIGSAFLLFNKCLSIHPKRYKKGLHARAKTGIERIKEIR